MQKSYDFAVLGDQQPEGLLLAAGLARRSFKVVIVPGPILGELPSLEAWPVRWPQRLGDSDRALEELLFKVGFFKLEEAGLSPEADQLQVLLKKNRFNFSGRQADWLRELCREIPRLESEFKKFKSAETQNPSAIQAQLDVLKVESPELADLVRLESLEGRPPVEARLKIQERRWLQKNLRAERTLYRLKAQESVPYSKFLLDHCRKWGVSVVEEPLSFQTGWRHFQISSSVKAHYVIVNSLAGARLLSEVRKDLSVEKMSHWMYFDRLVSSVESLPEPLGEFSVLASEDRQALPVWLHAHRDHLRDRATVTLGIWLPFQDSRVWESTIESARQSFRKLAPFVPDSCFRQVPSPLELNEMKGECVRRGELDRLQIESIVEPMTRFKNFWKSMMSKRRPRSLSGRILVSAPHLGSSGSRGESLEDCFKALEFFEKRIRHRVVSSTRASLL